MGFSNGGMTTLHIAIRHPQAVNKLVLASTPNRRDGMQPGFFEGLQHACLDDMPQPLKEAFLKANPDPRALRAMFDRDRARMLHERPVQRELVANYVSGSPSRWRLAALPVESRYESPARPATFNWPHPSRSRQARLRAAYAYTPSLQADIPLLAHATIKSDVDCYSRQQRLTWSMTGGPS